MMTPFICRGCQEPIMERYLMKVLDKSWHMQCVKCSDCQCVLNEKCFSRDSKLYCKTDFFKRYGTKCAGCNVGLCPEDLVRRAMNKVFHVHCFSCSMCRKQLNTGEQLYLVQNERFLCERCYQITTQSLATAKSTSVVTSSGSNTAQEQQDIGKFVLSTSSHGQEGSQQLSLVQHSPAVIGGSDGKKSKPRTSITPKQLEVLTLAYNEDQHPSKQVREELVATTGLEMKVIQVWFQNRRSKEKRDANYRDALKEDPTTINPVGGPTTPSSSSSTLNTSSIGTPQ